jgi:putative ABC transport system permease protein
VAAGIVMLALGNGARAAIEARIRTAGTNLIIVMPGSANVAASHRTGAPRTTLTADDADAIARQVTGIAAMSPGASTRAQVVAPIGNWYTQIQGASGELQAIRDWDTEFGAFFTGADVTRAAKVAVLGSVVRDQLFGAGVDPTGQSIRISNQPFTVAGVLTSKGQSAIGQDQDDTVVVPYTTVQKKLTGNTYLSNLTIEAASEDQIQAVASGISALLRERHRLQSGEADDFTVRTLEEMTSVLTSTTSTMTWLLASVSAVSLIVGGIGVMNIMLVSVTEADARDRSADVARRAQAGRAAAVPGRVAGAEPGRWARRNPARHRRVVRRQPAAVVECERVAGFGDRVIRVRGGDRRVLWSLSCPPRRRAEPDRSVAV